MPDRAAQAVVKRFWGETDKFAAPSGFEPAPIERYMQFRRLNNQGWKRIIGMHGVEGAQQYRDAMRDLGKNLGLEE